MEGIQDYIAELEYSLKALPVHEIDLAIHVLEIARENHKNIFIIGNGGSASTASHMVCDLAKNTRNNKLPNMRVFDLTSQSIITAYANDEGYENIFANQLKGLIRSYDVLIAISTSGNSLNIINAVDYAISKNANVIGMTGFDGGKLKEKSLIKIHIPSNCIEQVEDCHLIIGHIFTQQLKELALKEVS